MVNPLSKPQIDRCEQQKLLFLSFFRYLLTGGAGFMVDYGTLTLCYQLFEMHYLFASVIGFVSGLIFVYIISNKWVFFYRKMQQQQVLEFTIFGIIGVIGLLLTLVFMWVFTEICAIHVQISKLLTTALVLFWNFGARKFILY